jgi:hypothetical protein
MMTRDQLSPAETNSPVMPAQAGIQYAAASAFKAQMLWNTGSPAFAGMTMSFLAAALSI